jgi:ABC-2 type transport system ATP-binding protein
MAIDSVPAPVTDRTPAHPVIDVRGLVKSFGTTLVLDELALEVIPGEVHGLLGPNGAGKTTTLRILLGLLRADAGTVRVLGGDPWHDAAALHRRLAYVPGDVTLWPNLTGGEVIDMLGRMRGGLDHARRDDLIARFDLDPTKKGRTYSKGNRQKVALVAALASDVELLLLDEPTAGLDPLMDATFRDYIGEFRQAGRTVLLSSHILSEVEALCDRVSIIRQGVVVESGTMAQLRHLTRTSVVAEVEMVPAGLEHLPGVHDVAVQGHRVSASVENEGLSPLMASLGSGGLLSLTTAPPTLEELFLRHYRDVLPEPAAAAGNGDGSGAHRMHLGRRGKGSA